MARNTKRFGKAPDPTKGSGDFDAGPTRAHVPANRPPTSQPVVSTPAPDPHQAKTMITRAPTPPPTGMAHDRQVPAKIKPSDLIADARRVSDAGATVMMSSAKNEPASHIIKSQEPPEVGLTQHHLPEESIVDERMVLVDDPDSARAASFRVLRHHLLEAGRPQVVVVSSAKGLEGKTTTAVNLALALSECGRAKVLLVEANMRRPQLASIFRFVPPWCFSEQLVAHRNQPLLPWGVVDIPTMWLHVAAVNPRSEQTQLLDAPAFAIAMERLRLAGYDHIIIDAPSVLGSADVNLIQDAADGVVLTTMSKRSTARDLRRCIEQLSPTKIIGTVLLKD